MTTITAGERRFVDAHLSSVDEPCFMRWIAKTNKVGKVQPRLVVVTRFRVLSIARSSLGGSKEVKREGHLRDLVRIVSKSPRRVVLHWKTFKIDISADDSDPDAAPAEAGGGKKGKGGKKDKGGKSAGAEGAGGSPARLSMVDQLLSTLRQSLEDVSWGVPVERLPELDVEPAERLEATEPDPHDAGPAADFEAHYLAACDRFGCEPSEGLLLFVADAVAAKSTDLVLDQCPGIEDAPGEEEYIDLRPVALVLRHNAYFRSVVLRNVLDRRDALALLAPAFKSSPTLKRLILSRLDMVDGFARLSEILPSSSLSQLDLSGSRLGEGKNAQMLAAGLEKLTKGLSILQLDDCGLSGKNALAVGKALSANKAFSTSLVEVSLSGNPLGSAGTKAFLPLLVATSKLKPAQLKLRCIDVSRTQLDVHAFLTAVTDSKPLVRTLEFLDVSHNKCDKSGGSSAVARFLEEAQVLQYIGLSACKLGADDAYVLLSTLGGNGNLTMGNGAGGSGSGSGDGGGAAAASAAAPSPALSSSSSAAAGGGVEVDLSHNSLGVPGGRRVAEALATVRNVSALSLNDNGLGCVGLAPVLRALSANATILSVDLSRNIPGGGTEKDAVAAAAGASRDGPGAEHTVDDDKADPHGFLANGFRELLASHTSRLETLVLEGNAKFHYRFFGAITPSLEKSNSLRSLDITGNFCGDKAIVGLAKALTTNTTLLTLEFDSNLSGLTSWQALASCMARNKTLLQAPPPLRDIRRTLDRVKKEAPRARLRAKVVETMDALQTALAENRGDDTAPASFSGAMGPQGTFRRETMLSDIEKGAAAADSPSRTRRQSQLTRVSKKADRAALQSSSGKSPAKKATGAEDGGAAAAGDAAAGAPPPVKPRKPSAVADDVDDDAPMPAISRDSLASAIAKRSQARPVSIMAKPRRPTAGAARKKGPARGGAAAMQGTLRAAKPSALGDLPPPPPAVDDSPAASPAGPIAGGPLPPPPVAAAAASAADDSLDDDELAPPPEYLDDEDGWSDDDSDGDDAPPVPAPF